MNSSRRIGLVLLTIACCVCIDQFSKDLAASHLPRDGAWSFAGDILRLDYAENEGGVFSFESFLPKFWQGGNLSAASVVFLMLLTLHLSVSSTLGATSLVALSLVSGGSFSNLLDRMAFGGNVVDFMNVGWGCFRTCTFNAADVAITSGLFLFAASLLWRFRPRNSRQQ
jgi:signal peptidase II